MFGHFEFKHRCLAEENVTTLIFCSLNGSTFLRAKTGMRLQAIYEESFTDVFKLQKDLVAGAAILFV